jgi:hypothetical protein
MKTQDIPKLEHLSLQPPLQEVLRLQRQHVIQPHAGIVEHTDPDQTADKGVTLKETLGVLVLELEQLTGSTTDLGISKSSGIDSRGGSKTHLGQRKLNTPDFALVTETVLAGELRDQ